jgi:hypothetical protein
VNETQHSNLKTIYLQSREIGAQAMVDLMIKGGAGVDHVGTLVQALALYDRSRWVTRLPVKGIIDEPTVEDLVQPCTVMATGPTPPLLFEDLQLNDESIFV